MGNVPDARSIGLPSVRHIAHCLLPTGNDEVDFRFCCSVNTPVDAAYFSRDSILDFKCQRLFLIPNLLI
jgi:hypothetical protein